MSIYFDNNATTPLDPLVLESMYLDFKSGPLNPSSNHFFGKKAKALLIESRRKIASLLKAQEDKIIFTSGGTEGLNLLINGFVKSYNIQHIVSSEIEHLAVFNTLSALEKKVKVTYLKANTQGNIDPKEIIEVITDQTQLIILSAVNTETGVLNDLEAIAKIAKDKKIYLIVDGVGILGKSPFVFYEGISAMAFSSHKIHGPKGIGFIYLNKKNSLSPQILGGSQEYNLRAGTENLAGIIATAKALEIAYDDLQKKIEYIKFLRDTFEQILSQNLNVYINGDGPRICNVSNIAFTGIDGEDLLRKLDLQRICASHGSACSSNSTQLSRILLNMGYDIARVKSSIRFSFSRMNTFEEVEKACYIIINILNMSKY